MSDTLTVEELDDYDDEIRWTLALEYLPLHEKVLAAARKGIEARELLKYTEEAFELLKLTFAAHRPMNDEQIVYVDRRIDALLMKALYGEPSPPEAQEGAENKIARGLKEAIAVAKGAAPGRITRYQVEGGSPTRTTPPHDGSYWGPGLDPYHAEYGCAPQEARKEGAEIHVGLDFTSKSEICGGMGAETYHTTDITDTDEDPIMPSPTDSGETVSAQDPFVILAGIKQFGLAPDGADLRDLEAILRQWTKVVAKCHAERDAAIRKTETPSSGETVEGLVERLESEFHDYDCHALRLEAADALRRLSQERDALALNAVGLEKDLHLTKMARDLFAEQRDTVAADRDRLQKEVERLSAELEGRRYG